MDQIEVTANHMVFRGFASGPIDGPIALLAHGFPDSPATWRHLHGPLADAGYRVISLAMRGYGPSDIPADGNYQGAALALDLVEIDKVLATGDRSVLIGHDWGALATYGAAALAPGRWRSMVTLAVPPPGSGPMFSSTAQLKRSWYIFYFQTPGAELMVGHPAAELLATLWRDWSPGYDATEDLAALLAALDSPERISAAVGYYRAMFDQSRHDPALAEAQHALRDPISTPTLYLHGADDGCLGLDVIGDPIAALPAGSSVKIVEGAGHFLHLEQPAIVASAILDFLGPAR